MDNRKFLRNGCAEDHSPCGQSSYARERAHDPLLIATRGLHLRRSCGAAFIGSFVCNGRTSSFSQDSARYRERVGTARCAQSAKHRPLHSRLPALRAAPEYDQAFSTIGEALYWAYRGGMEPERHTAMKRKWDDLDNGARLAAGVVLHELRSASWRAAPTDQDAAPDLKSLWSLEVEAIALHCVENREALMAGLRRYAYDGRLVKDMIETLGAIGTLRAVSLLRAVADDSCVQQRRNQRPATHTTAGCRDWPKRHLAEGETAGDLQRTCPAEGRGTFWRRLASAASPASSDRIARTLKVRFFSLNALLHCSVVGESLLTLVSSRAKCREPFPRAIRRLPKDYRRHDCAGLFRAAK